MLSNDEHVAVPSWYEIGHHQRPNIWLAMKYALSAANEKELDGWDTVLRYSPQPACMHAVHSSLTSGSIAEHWSSGCYPSTIKKKEEVLSG